MHLPSRVSVAYPNHLGGAPRATGTGSRSPHRRLVDHHGNVPRTSPTTSCSIVVLPSDDCESSVSTLASSTLGASEPRRACCTPHKRESEHQPPRASSRSLRQWRPAHRLPI